MAENFTSADFHNVVHKQLLNVVFDTLAKSKLDWEEVAPFLQAARKLARSDFEHSGRARIHAVRAEGESWVEAEEAYIGLSVADRDNEEEWLSETWWLSDIVIAENDRDQVAQILAALERSLAKVRRGLEESDGPAGTESGTDEAS
ncbi:MAG: hypothetical protein ACXW2T_03685 [Allosphingosinicella sp.]